jgi:hypothetical protein
MYYNVTLRLVRVTIVAMEKLLFKKYYELMSIASVTHNAKTCAVLYCHLLITLILPYLSTLLQTARFSGEILLNKKCVF